MKKFALKYGLSVSLASQSLTHRLLAWLTSRLVAIGLPLLLALGAGAALAQNAPIALLVPDGVSASDPRVASWLDAAREEGFRVDLITDSQFMLMASAGGTPAYRGVILPDQVHSQASDALVNTVYTYVNAGGNVMLVFDFGVLDGAGFYPLSGGSRFGPLAGVDYCLYAELGDRTTGLGPITGMESQLRRISVPPGKSMPYAATNTNTAQALFLPVSNSNPGGVKGYDHSQQLSLAFVDRTKTSKTTFPNKTIRFSTAVQGPKVQSTTSLATLAATTDTLEAISGYVYGFLTYPSFVTRGSYAGDMIASSPYHGLVAGISAYGTAGGRVLFVNTPLTYLKGATDGMLMHGFMSVFAREMLNQPRLARTPNARPGMTLNWHLDAQEAMEPMRFLKANNVWKGGPFSIHMTAGPDVVNFGDALGFNLPQNTEAQQFLRDFVKQGHQVGSHGGWIHDYYGLNATEDNQFALTADGVHTFQDLLDLNRNAIQAVIGQGRVIEYSSPEGNNPKWALRWLQERNTIGYYYGGDTGMGPTRDYRDGVMTTPNMWAFPVMPFGIYATFEEFQDFGVADADVLNWYEQLIDFNIQTRTSRLIYMHPPGAVDSFSVLKSMLDYAKSKSSGKNFQWYTMAELANFMTARNQVTWTEKSTLGMRQFNASHPVSLATMSWQLPKSAYSSPLVLSGQAVVADGGDDWIVRATGGTSLVFMSIPR